MKNFIDNFTSHPCTVCEASFDSKDELNEHLIDKHGYCRTYLCPICKKKFATKDAIKKHMIENHRKSDSNESAEVNKKRHQCMICDNSYDERQHLTKHISDVHDSYYKNAFLKKSQLKKPVKEQEQQNLSSIIQKPNVCNFCNRYFLEKEELKEHNLKEHCKKSKAKDLETLKANNLAYAQSQFQIDAKKSKTNNHHQSLPTIEDSQEIQK